MKDISAVCEAFLVGVLRLEWTLGNAGAVNSNLVSD